MGPSSKWGWALNGPGLYLPFGFFFVNNVMSINFHTTGHQAAVLSLYIFVSCLLPIAQLWKCGPMSSHSTSAHSVQRRTCMDRVRCYDRQELTAKASWNAAIIVLSLFPLLGYS